MRVGGCHGNAPHGARPTSPTGSLDVSLMLVAPLIGKSSVRFRTRDVPDTHGFDTFHLQYVATVIIIVVCRCGSDSEEIHIFMVIDEILDIFFYGLCEVFLPDTAFYRVRTHFLLYAYQSAEYCTVDQRRESLSCVAEGHLFNPLKPKLV